MVYLYFWNTLSILAMVQSTPGCSWLYLSSNPLKAWSSCTFSSEPSWNSKGEILTPLKLRVAALRWYYIKCYTGTNPYDNGYCLDYFPMDANKNPRRPVVGCMTTKYYRSQSAFHLWITSENRNLRKGQTGSWLIVLGTGLEASELEELLLLLLFEFGHGASHLLHVPQTLFFAFVQLLL